MVGLKALFLNYIKAVKVQKKIHHKEIKWNEVGIMKLGSRRLVLWLNYNYWLFTASLGLNFAPFAVSENFKFVFLPAGNKRLITPHPAVAKATHPPTLKLWSSRRATGHRSLYFKIKNSQRRLIECSTSLQLSLQSTNGTRSP